MRFLVGGDALIAPHSRDVIRYRGPMRASPPTFSVFYIANNFAPAYEIPILHSANKLCTIKEALKRLFFETPITIDKEGICMQIFVRDNPQQVAEVAGALIRAQVLRKPQSVLGLATGSTPIPLYDELVRLHGAGQVDMSRITTYNLDEYAGLAADHPQSYHFFMWEKLLSRIGMNPSQVHLPNGTAKDLDAECQRYEAQIEAAGGIDLQVLGIGHNGHIGFNEPGDVFSNRTCVAQLTESTIQANLRFFDSEDQVPRTALTMGIRTIFQSREILLIACGAAKANIIAQMVHGAITPQVPASVLQLHPNTRLLLDKEAAAEL